MIWYIRKDDWDCVGWLETGKRGGRNDLPHVKEKCAIHKKREKIIEEGTAKKYNRYVDYVKNTLSNYDMYNKKSSTQNKFIN